MVGQVSAFIGRGNTGPCVRFNAVSLLHSFLTARTTNLIEYGGRPTRLLIEQLIFTRFLFHDWSHETHGRVSRASKILCILALSYTLRPVRTDIPLAHGVHRVGETLATSGVL